VRRTLSSCAASQASRISFSSADMIVTTGSPVAVAEYMVGQTSLCVYSLRRRTCCASCADCQTRSGPSEGEYSPHDKAGHGRVRAEVEVRSGRKGRGLRSLYCTAILHCVCAEQSLERESG
jgi:hypothetical protein